MRLAATSLLILLLAACGDSARDAAGERPPQPGPKESAAVVEAPPAKLPALKAVPETRVDENGVRYSTIDGAQFVLVTGGTCRIGDDDGRYDERPAFPARLSPFLLDRAEVSNAQFERFVEATGYKPAGPWRRGFGTGEGELPVRFVSWHDAAEYAKWAKRRLPTEAEWEAAFGGKRYPWGDEWELGRAVTNRPVGQGPKPVSSGTDRAACGAVNLGGNVREWVADWYDRYAWAELAQADLAENPTGPPDGALPEARFIDTATVAGNERSTRKVVRGAGWASPGREFARRSRRGAHNPHQWFNDVGFRCALSVEVEE